MRSSVEIDQDDTELALMESIRAGEKRSAPLRQRDLAIVTGASLGMTNAILKRLAQKGFIAVQKINSRNIRYAITPDGLNEIARRSYRCFKRTIRTMSSYRERLDAAVVAARLDGMEAVVLVGSSDLDFLLEHTCARLGLPLFREKDTLRAPITAGNLTVLRVYSEDLPEKQERAHSELYLSQLLALRN